MLLFTSKRHISTLSIVAILASIMPPLIVPTAYAAAVPSCSITEGPAITTFSGEAFTFTTVLDNTGGDPGFTPMIEMVLPEEVTFNSATFSLGGLAITPSTPTPTVITDNDAGDPATGTVTNPITGSSAVLPVGTTYIAFQIPLGSYVPSQAPISITTQATLDPNLAAGVPLTQSLQARCGFALGEDALNNPSVDPPVVGSFTTATVTPTVVIMNKESVTTDGEGGAQETATGPNFPVSHTVNFDVANGSTVTGISATDLLPDTLQFTSVTSINDGGSPYTIRFFPSDGSLVQTSSTVPFTPVGPFPPGGRLEVDFGTVTGAVTNNDLSLTYQTYVPEFDFAGTEVLSPTAGSARVITNTATGATVFSGAVLPSIASDSITAKSLAIQKNSPTIIANSGPAGFSPGDTLRYTLDVQVSDYFSMDTIVIEDLLPDGMQYVPASAEFDVEEQGASTTNITFVEDLTITEANVVTGPPYDFAGGDCLGCELALTYDGSNDDDATDPPGDGRSVMAMDISTAMNGELGFDDELLGGSGSSATRLTLRYETVIQESFIDGQVNDQSVDALDQLNNNVKVSGAITSTVGGGTIQDTSSNTITIVAPTFAKTIAAFTDGGSVVVPAPSPVEVSPGDTVTYSLQTTIPSGDLEELVLTDFLPLPVFDVSEFSTTFDSTVYTPTNGAPGSIPAAGTVAYGNNTAGFPGPLPTPVLTKDVASNSITIDFIDNTTFEETPSNGIVVELLLTATVTTEPFADGLKLVNVVSFTGGNSTTTTATTAGAGIDITTNAAELDVHKGAVAVEATNASAVFSPATVGPTTFTTAGAVGTPFTAPFSSTDLNTNPIDSNVSVVDAGDKVRFALVIENTGSAEAYNLQVTDTLPTGFSTPASSADLNLQVFDANGNDLTTSFEGGLFGFTINGGTGSGTNTTVNSTAAYSLPPLDTTTALTGEGQANEGANIVVLTYDLTLASTVTPLEQVTNTGALQRFSGALGGPNFVSDTSLYTESASATIGDISVSKSVQLAGTGDYTHTALPNVTFGERVQYKVAITATEGTSSGFTFRDYIPNRMGYDRDVGVTVDGSVACSGVAFNGVLPTFTVTSPTGSGLANAGVDLQGTLSTFVTTADNDNTNNTFCLLYEAVVRNAGSANTQTNRARITHPLGFQEDTAQVTIREPLLNVTKSASATSNLDAGDEVTYTINLAHLGGSTTDAFDIQIRDQINSKLVVNTNFSSDGLDNDGDGIVDGGDPDEIDGSPAFYTFSSGSGAFTWNSATTSNTDFDQLATASGITLQFKVNIANTVAAAEVIANGVNVNWDNLPGSGNSEEKTATDFANRNITMTAVDATKTVAGTSLADTTAAAFNATLQDLAIGEIVRYQIAVDVPESQMTNFVVTDVLPNPTTMGAFRALSGALLSDDGITHGFTGAIVQDNLGADGINETVVFNFGSITNAPDADTETLLVEISAMVVDEVANAANTNYINTVSVDYTENPGAAVTDSQAVDVVEPSLAVVKTATPNTGDAGDTVQYSITVTNNGSAPAYDIELIDVVDGLLNTQTSFAFDGLDNIGNGFIDDPLEDPPYDFYSGGTFTWNSVTTLVPAFAKLDPASSITVQYNAQLGVGVTPNSTITNTATATYSTLPGVSANERSYTNSGSNILAVSTGAIALAKSITSSSTELLIGDTVDYRIQVNVAEGTTDPVVVTDTLPAGLAYVPGTTVITESSPVELTIENTITDPAQAPSSTTIGSGSPQTLTFNFGEVINSNTNDGVAETITIDFTAVALNTVDNVQGSTKTNTVSASFAGFAVGPVNAAVVTIVEPDISIDVATTYIEGNTAVYQLNIENNALSTSGTGYNVVAQVQVPTGFTLSGSYTLVNGPVPTYTLSGTTLTFEWSAIDTTYNNANPIMITFEGVLGTSLPSGTVLSTTGSLTYTSQLGTPANVITGNALSSERTGNPADSGGVVNTYNDSDTQLLTVTRPDLRTSTKTVVDLNGGTVEANDLLQYTINVINTGNSTGTSIRVTDDIPANVNSFTVNSIPAGASNNSQGAGSGANATGYLDVDTITVSPGSSGAITYTVTVDTNIGTGTVIVNDATILPAVEGGLGATDSVSIGAAFPELLIAKTPSSTTVQGGTSVQYTVTITNTGSVASTNTVITDVIPSGLTYNTGSLQFGTGSALTDVKDADIGDYNQTTTGAVTFVIPSIPAGGTGAYMYSAITSAATTTYSVTNTVTVTDDQGSNETDSATIVVLGSGGGSGGGGGGSRRGGNASFVPPQITVQSSSSSSQLETIADSEQEKITIRADACTFDDVSRTYVWPKTGELPNWLAQKYGVSSLFNDASYNDAYYKETAGLYLACIVQGQNNQPVVDLQSNLKRSEVAAILTRALSTSNQIEYILTPVYPDEAVAWYNSYTSWTTENGIFKGYEDGTFGPGDNITVFQGMLLAARMLGLPDPDNLAEAKRVLGNRGVIPDQLLFEQDLNRSLTRGEFFSVVYRVISTQFTGNQTYADSIFVSIPSAGVAQEHSFNTLLSQNNVWLQSLMDGPGFYEDGTGRMILFAHSSGYKDSAGQLVHGTEFAPLINKLNVGDTVEVNRNGVFIKYRIITKQKVNENDTSLLQSPNADVKLTIATCNRDFADDPSIEYRYVWEAVPEL